MNRQLPANGLGPAIGLRLAAGGRAGIVSACVAWATLLGLIGTASVSGQMPGEAPALQAEPLPGDPLALYNRGCEQAAAGELAAAADLFRLASQGQDRELVSNSHYNLGCLAATRARRLLEADEADGTSAPATPGGSPAPLGSQGANDRGQPGDELAQRREEILRLADEAETHFRQALDTDPSHGAARRNLERLRSWRIRTLAAWEQADRERRRGRLQLLEFLDWMQQAQASHRGACRQLAAQRATPRRRELVDEQQRWQADFGEECAALANKLQAALEATREPANSTPQQPAGQPDPAQANRIAQLFDELLRVARDRSARAAHELRLQLPDAALQSQAEVLDALNEIYLIVAPWEHVLQRAIDRQRALIDETRGDAQPLDELQRDQQRVTMWCQWLGLKANQELSDRESEPGGASPAEQDAQAARVKALQRARELAPQAEVAARQAAEQLAEGNRQTPLPHQQEALRLLEEIARELPPPNQQQSPQPQDQSDQNQQRQNQPQQNQQQQQGQQPDQGSESPPRQDQQQPAAGQDRQSGASQPPPEPDSPGGRPNEQQQGEKEKQGEPEGQPDSQREAQQKPEPQQAGKSPAAGAEADPSGQTGDSQAGPDSTAQRLELPAEQVEALLRRVRERERRYLEERKRQLRAGGRIRVERDW